MANLKGHLTLPAWWVVVIPHHVTPVFLIPKRFQFCRCFSIRIGLFATLFIKGWTFSIKFWNEIFVSRRCLMSRKMVESAHSIMYLIDALFSYLQNLIDFHLPFYGIDLRLVIHQIKSSKFYITHFVHSLIFRIRQTYWIKWSP